MGIEMKNRIIITMLFVATTSLAATNTPYLVKNGDALTVIFHGIQSQNAEIQDIVDQNGFISLPFLGKIPAADRSTTQLESEIQQQYVTNGIYKSVTINVVVLNPGALTNRIVEIPRPSTSPQQGDFWLPGEYQKKLQNKQER